MPPETSSFPEEVQLAFFIFDFLEDRFEGMSGTYMGKSWNNLEYLFNLYNIEEPKLVLFFMKLYEQIVIKHKMQKAEKERKAEERRSKSAGGGKNYTHNVKA